MREYFEFINKEMKQSKRLILFVILLLTVVNFIISDFQYRNYTDYDYNHINNSPGIDYESVLKSNKLILQSDSKDMLNKDLVKSIKFQNRMYPKAIKYLEDRDYHNLNKIETIIFIHEMYTQLIAEKKNEYRNYAKDIVKDLGYEREMDLVLPKNLRIGEKNNLGYAKIATDYKYRIYKNDVVSINYKNRGTIPFLEFLFNNVFAILALILTLVFAAKSIIEDQSQGILKILFHSKINRRKYYVLKLISNFLKIVICISISVLIVFLLTGIRSRFNRMDTPVLISSNYMNSFFNKSIDYEYQIKKFGSSYLGIVQTDFGLDGIVKTINPKDFTFIRYGKYISLEVIYLLITILIILSIVQLISSLAKDAITSSIFSSFLVIGIVIISQLIYKFYGCYYIIIGQLKLARVFTGGNTTSFLYFLLVSFIFILVVNVYGTIKYDKKDIG
ncbi:MAG: ABC transporter permease subunit [Peptoniphilaceae bacterium]|nr:ABC transporter permease subunit [Peptoniphilaceae bacterium]MDY6018875.1 ABC transporter permease subunit [Anaerococcus sp.]